MVSLLTLEICTKPENHQIQVWPILFFMCNVCLPSAVWHLLALLQNDKEKSSKITISLFNTLLFLNVVQYFVL